MQLRAENQNPVSALSNDPLTLCRFSGFTAIPTLPDFHGTILYIASSNAA